MKSKCLLALSTIAAGLVVGCSGGDGPDAAASDESDLTTAVIAFPSAAGVIPAPRLDAGGSVTIKYDPARLARLQPRCTGKPVHVGFRVNADAEQQKDDAGVIDLAGRSFPLPNDASLVSFWFFCEGTGQPNRLFDSQAGKNYDFPVAGGPVLLPLLTPVDTQLAAPNTEQSFQFKGRAGWKIEVSVSATNRGGPAFIPQVGLTVLEKGKETPQNVLTSPIVGDVTGAAKRTLTLNADGKYRIGVRATDGRIGGMRVRLTVDLPCKHETEHADCPAPLTCQVLTDAWSWSTLPGLKCLPPKH